MILGEVLHVLKEAADAICSTNSALYVLLFTDEPLSESTSYEETAKQLFKDRGLKSELRANLCEEANFNKFCKTIEERLLRKINRHNEIYSNLRLLIEECVYLPEEHKVTLLSTCDPTNCFQLARLIAACILCGSYNSSMQQNKRNKNKSTYGLSLAFMNLDATVLYFPTCQRIWEAEQKSFIASRQEGSRFYDLNIIERLLPHGFITPNNFRLHARTEDGEIRPLMDIYKDHSAQDIAITGEGGIGKTTFLQQLLEEEYWNKEKLPTTYKSGKPVPIFVELKQCPSQIQDWYEEEYHKTNFITRYIGQLLENHLSLSEISDDTLKLVEKELQRIPPNNIPQYLILLDGFNEISVSEKGDTYSCRSLLSNEITVIHQNYANVRIIATSRETQAAYFTSSFQNVYLLGLEDNDIIQHLKNCNFSETSIGLTMANKTLLKCLRVPLFLCMYSYENRKTDAFLPETQGEILYHFFHGNSTFYNARKRANDTHTNPLNELQTAMVLDFILPYIGWCIERANIFSISEKNLKLHIMDALKIIEKLILPYELLPYEDFQYDSELFSATFNSIMQLSNPDKQIISCAYDYLGILYQYVAPEKEISERRQYSFIHHYFRDYFSAIFDIQLLKMLSIIDYNDFIPNSSPKALTYSYFLNSCFWPQGKTELVSQILMEHRNKPVLNPKTKNWSLPLAKTNEQKVLTDALEICRKSIQRYPTHYLLHNILSAVIFGRQELSGMNLKNINFSHCNIFNTPCSKKGATQFLSASFDNSYLPNNFLEPDDHVDHIEEYVYWGQNCFTLDGAGVIKCWDILSGCLEYILQSGDPNGMKDLSPNGFMKISSDGHWLAAKAYNYIEAPNISKASLYVFNLSSLDDDPYILQPPKEHTTITSFSFTEDCKNILFLADRHELYCFEIESGSVLYHHVFSEFLKHSELYAADAESNIYVFSGEYDYFDSASYYPEFDDEEPVPDEYAYNEESGNDDDWDDLEIIPIPCLLLQCNPFNGIVETLYIFNSTPGTYPVTKYFPSLNCFLLFNEEGQQLEYFSCSTKTAIPVYQGITAENNGAIPSAIQYCPEHKNDCYIMYPEICYYVHLLSHDQSGILMKYNVSALNDLIDDDSQMEELVFYPNVVPCHNRFIVRNSENTYEWDTANDTLYRRYNATMYEVCDMIYDHIHQLAILIHHFNGVSVFGGEPLKLLYSLCYPHPEYYASGCAYNECTMQLAIMFYKSSHEYVELINLNTCEREIIYSTLQAHDTLQSVQFDSNGKHLLITLGSCCNEYECNTHKTYCVANASENELFIDGSYTDDPHSQIRIAIVEHFNYDEPHTEPHCDHYSIIENNKAKLRIYKKEWRYYMPSLDTDTAKNFICYNNDLGTGASYTKEEYQTYWCTCGFYLHDCPTDDFFQKIRCVQFSGNKETSFQKDFGPLQMIYCRHDFALANQYRTEKNRVTYSYCSDDFSEIIEMFEHFKITHWKNLHTEPQSVTYIYDDGETTSDEIPYAYWDTAIPWGSDSLIASYEQFHLMLLKEKGKGQSIEIPYTPSIAISECSFHNVTASHELLELLKNNGAKL